VTFRRLLGSLVIVGIALLVLPEPAWAWTPGTHVYLGESLLANLFSGTVGYLRNRVRVLPLHEAILDAIRTRKPDAARRAVRRLLESTQKTIEQSGKVKPAAPAKPRQRKPAKV